MKKILVSLCMAAALLVSCSNTSSPVAQVCEIMNNMAEKFAKMDVDNVTPEDQAEIAKAGERLDSITQANADLKLTAEDKAALKEASNNMGEAVIRQQAKALGMDVNSEEIRQQIEMTRQATDQSIDNMTTLGGL
ncbi:MAG: hypothetical protein K2J92_02945 [Muribaculaceae bacterium]|nr:hypothetical protein [Bacteroides sp.]MDE6680290.1 hypothetical protein [Muribaculaceae bacterium]MDE6843460.1 hypothetical protein [Muribaculaceae bacterium]